MSGDRATWIYAVARGMADGALDGVPGLGGGPVRVITAAGLAAAVTDVSLEEFGEEPLRRHLEDLSWLDSAARTHHQVIEAISRHGPVVPMRLATVFRDDRSVAGLLTQRHADFASALARITGRTEWGIKVYATAPGQDRPPARDPAAGTPEPAAAGAGAAYLRRRRQAISADADARHAASASAEAIQAALGAMAAAVQFRPPQAPQLSGDPARMILNAAFLVDDARSEDFTAAARGMAGQHPAVRVELTGPWPPYSFAADLTDLPEGAPA